MSDAYLPAPARIIAIHPETADKSIKTFTLSLTDENQSEEFDFLPGQFIELFLPGQGEFPVGIASSPAERGIIKVTVKKAGLATTHLHSLFIDDIVGVRGPLGKPFPWSKMVNNNIMLIGGGFAFTTLRAAIHHMMDSENRPQYREIHVVYGAASPEFLLYRDELEKWSQAGEDIHINLTVDQADSTNWNHSTGLVPEIVRRNGPADSANTFALVCGPPIMVKFTIPVLKELGYADDQIYMSLENKMKCGVGLCGRCNIGPKFVCKDGPVFSMEDLEQLPDEF